MWVRGGGGNVVFFFFFVSQSKTEKTNGPWGLGVPSLTTIVLLFVTDFPSQKRDESIVEMSLL